MFSENTQFYKDQKIRFIIIFAPTWGIYFLYEFLRDQLKLQCTKKCIENCFKRNIWRLEGHRPNFKTFKINEKKTDDNIIVFYALLLFFFMIPVHIFYDFVMEKIKRRTAMAK